MNDIQYTLSSVVTMTYNPSFFCCSQLADVGLNGRVPDLVRRGSFRDLLRADQLPYPLHRQPETPQLVSLTRRCLVVGVPAAAVLDNALELRHLGLELGVLLLQHLKLVLLLLPVLLHGQAVPLLALGLNLADLGALLVLDPSLEERLVLVLHHGGALRGHRDHLARCLGYARCTVQSRLESAQPAAGGQPRVQVDFLFDLILLERAAVPAVVPVGVRQVAEHLAAEGAELWCLVLHAPGCVQVVFHGL
mmetsp:Transcript_11903/g.32890  ORF Transcript_11903/g.32890 Transcript_11903/m.32890 type:complete len:249 (+) Transcript_11903:70-816(+)